MTYRLDIDSWGPAAWHTLHAFAHTAPEKFDFVFNRKFQEFLLHFADFLPCPRCARHFRSYVEANFYPEIATRSALIAFLNDAHNAVNVRRGKPTFSLKKHVHFYTNALQSPMHKHATTAAVAVAAVGGAVLVYQSTRTRPQTRDA